MIISRRGFSLIELLVVIAIIAILAAILFPVITAAKNKSKLSGCLSHQKQLVLGMLNYMSDSNDKFPWAGAASGAQHNTGMPPVGIGGSKTLPEAIKKYVKNIGVRWCPAWPNSTKQDPIGWSYWYYCPHMGSDLDGNPYVGTKGYNNGKAALCGFSMSDVTYPSRKPAICEVSTMHRTQINNDSNYVYPIAYCDGHVRAVNISGNGWTQQEIKVLYVGRDGSIP